LLLLLLLLEVPKHKHGGLGKEEAAATDVGWGKGDGGFSSFGREGDGGAVMWCRWGGREGMIRVRRHEIQEHTASSYCSL